MQKWLDGFHGLFLFIYFGPEVSCEINEGKLLKKENKAFTCADGDITCDFGFSLSWPNFSKSCHSHRDVEHKRPPWRKLTFSTVHWAHLNESKDATESFSYTVAKLTACAFGSRAAFTYSLKTVRGMWLHCGRASVWVYGIHNGRKKG